MSAPYWGELPNPKVVKQDRGSQDMSHYEGQRQSLDSQQQPQMNRASIMTANTATTFSPSYETPRASAYDPAGLAPRPPSMQKAPASADDTIDLPKRRSRHHNYDVNEYEDAGSPAPPAAPDVPRAPPVSYRHPYGNGGLPYTHPGSGQPRAPRQVVSNPLPGSDIPPEDYYRRESTDYPASPARQPIQDARTDREFTPREEATQPRRASASGPSERRRNMTKEEKRARVEAAERRARERAARKASGEPEVQQSSRTHARRPSTTYEPELSRARAPEPSAAPPQPMAREAPIRSDPSERRPSQQYGQPIPSRAYDPRPEAQYAERQTQERVPRGQPRYEPDAGIPKRNLSFKERAGQDELRLPRQEDAAPLPRERVPSGGYALTREGSNKLRKDPPGDAWQQHRQQAEKRMIAARHDSPEAMGRIPPETVPRSMQQKQLPADPPPLDPRAQRFNADPKSRYNQPPEPDYQGIRRSATEPVRARDYDSDEEQIPPPTRGKKVINFAEDPRRQPQAAAAAQRQMERQDQPAESEHNHRISGMVFKGREHMSAGDGLYKPPEWLDAWKKGTVGALSGKLLDLAEDDESGSDKAWWEKDAGGSRHRRRQSRSATAYADDQYDSDAPTKFKPHLYLQCGPLLRYCGMRQEKLPAKYSRTGVPTEKEFWRGSVMIVTKDSESNYEIAPTLRLFVQNVELLSTPPHHVDGELPSEHVDPIAGHPKLGRRGETLYVRPVEHLQEARDLSQQEADNGLFETTRSLLEGPDGSLDSPGSFISRRRRGGIDGEKQSKFKDVRGFRLHAERGYTFWRFNIEVELRERQQRIAYRINRGPANGFWVPAHGQVMNIMFHSCNGFSKGVNPNDFCGPDPMWRDVLNSHQSRPFHVMIGGGDQIYNDAVDTDCELFDEWLDLRNPLHKHNAPFTTEMQDELEAFYLARYCKWFSQGLFGLATSQIPMVNMLDDHDIYDGYGSYPHHDMNSPVMTGLGAVAFKYYMLFQHQSIIPETEATEPSWIVGVQPGPYINECSRSLYMSLGSKVSLLAVDGRTERSEHDVVQDKTWEKIMNRLYAEVRRGQVEHLLVLLGVPIAYPRLVWLENLLTSRFMGPVKALGKVGIFGKALNRIDDGVEVLDDLNDHWTAKNHQHERSIVIEDLQDLAIDKSLRVTLLSGDVHLAAIGQFYSNPKLGLAKHKDPRYMPNVISSAIVNAPPPDVVADILNKRHKTYHFDTQTDECMIPVFHHGADGKARNNKRLLPHRSWCSIRQWQPGNTPPPTPPESSHGDDSPTPPPTRGGSLLRRLSGRKASNSQPDVSRESVRGPRPPVSGGMGLFRGLSRRNSSSNSNTGNSPKPGFLKRTLSLGRGESRNREYDDDYEKEKEGGGRGLFGFRRRGSQSRPDDGGINGQWGVDSDDDYLDIRDNRAVEPSGLRGGAAYDEYSEGDEEYFSARPPPRAQTMPVSAALASTSDADAPPIRPFHRTPTGLSVKQMKKAQTLEVDVEGGLDVCLNVEVNPKDPTGITVPYRILVPKLFYEYNPNVDSLPHKTPTGFKRLLSMRKKQNTSYTDNGGGGGSNKQWSMSGGAGGDYLPRESEPHDVHFQE